MVKKKDKVIQLSKVYNRETPREEKIIEALNRVASENKIVCMVENKGEIYIVVE